ncbi:hypothetical protein MAJ_11098, partial [Metarhizium majus ARSEF 297]
MRPYFLALALTAAAAPKSPAAEEHVAKFGDTRPISNDPRPVSGTLVPRQRPDGTEEVGLLCATADALTLTPAVPLGILLHIYRFFRKLAQPEPLPKFEHMRGVRDSAWTSILNEKVYTQLYSDNSFQERLKDSLLFTELAVLSKAALGIGLANPDVLSAMQASTSDTDKSKTQSLSLSAANNIREGISN